MIQLKAKKIVSENLQKNKNKEQNNLIKTMEHIMKNYLMSQQT